MSNKTVIKRQGLMRLIFTLSHSFNGLKWMSRFEAAFQQELALFSLLGVFVWLQKIVLSDKLLLIASLLFVLFAELVNTAVEVVVDRISAMQLNAQNIILNNLVNQIVDELTFKHPSIKARLNNEITDEFTLNADEFSLNTILCNLIDNALFYGLPEAPIKLTAVNNSTNMTISVSNKVNKPLSGEQLTAIFDPLYQLDSSRTNNQRHGLGLSIVQSLCNLNSFTITASNTQNNTLTFILTLPLK